jgi:hypothetical protein
MERVNGKNKKDMLILINIMEIIIKTKNMDMESFNGKVAMFTKEIMKMINDMDTESFNGLMELYIKVNGNMELNMEKDNYGFQMENSKKVFLKIMFINLL